MYGNDNSLIAGDYAALNVGYYYNGFMTPLLFVFVILYRMQTVAIAQDKTV